MHTLKEEVIILIYLIMYGIYLFSSLDILNIICKKTKKKIISIFVQVMYWIAQLCLTFIFSYNLMEGYVPIYFILFIYFGYYIYKKLFKKYYISIIENILKVLKKIFLQIIKILKPIIYSNTLIKISKKIVKRECKIIKNTIFKRKK